MFSFADIMNHSTAGPDSATIIRRLLGPLWDNWFTQSPDAETTVIPRQAGLLIQHALAILQLKFAEATQMKIRAKTAYAEMVQASAKRRRTA